MQQYINLPGMQIAGKRIGRLMMPFLLIGLALGARAQKHGAITINDHVINIDSLNEQINDMLKNSGVPGMSLALFNDQGIVFYNVYGRRQLEKERQVNKKTIFEAASLTKSFLVFIVHQLVDQGRLDLDKPMYQYLPNPRLEHDARYKQITPRMILSHSSGIENWQRFNNPDTLEIISDPGTQFVYSGEGFQYLAKVVEGILNQPYEQYIREMVIKPLRLKRTFTSYSRKGNYPSNYAIGYDGFEKGFEKWKNREGVPASGIHLIAKDYAKLVIATFNRKYLSDKETRAIYKPVIKMDDNIPGLFYGMGYEVLNSPTDTVILHGGSNDGFRSTIYYSVVKKCGMIFLTNSDRGDLLSKRMNEITLQLPIESKFSADPVAQYPSNANTLLLAYNEKGQDEMFSRMEEMTGKNNGRLDDLTFNELGYRFFSAQKTDVAARLFGEYSRQYPGSPVPYYFLGIIEMNKKDFESAYRDLKKAKDLNFSFFPIDQDLIRCEKELDKKVSKQ